MFVLFIFMFLFIAYISRAFFPSGFLVHPDRGMTMTMQVSYFPCLSTGRPKCWRLQKDRMCQPHSSNQTLLQGTHNHIYKLFCSKLFTHNYKSNCIISRVVSCLHFVVSSVILGPLACYIYPRWFTLHCFGLFLCSVHFLSCYSLSCLTWVWKPQLGFIFATLTNLNLQVVTDKIKWNEEIFKQLWLVRLYCKTFSSEVLCETREG